MRTVCYHGFFCTNVRLSEGLLFKLDTSEEVSILFFLSYSLNVFRLQRWKATVSMWNNYLPPKPPIYEKDLYKWLSLCDVSLYFLGDSFLYMFWDCYGSCIGIISPFFPLLICGIWDAWVYIAHDSSAECAPSKIGAVQVGERNATFSLYTLWNSRATSGIDIQLELHDIVRIFIISVFVVEILCGCCLQAYIPISASVSSRSSAVEGTSRAETFLVPLFRDWRSFD